MRTLSFGPLLAALALASACTAGEEPPRADDDAPTPVVLTATDFTFDAPDTVPAGFIHVSMTNRGDEPHSATLVRLDSGKTLPEWVEVYREANRTRGPRPAWASFHGGVAAFGPSASGTATMFVEPGNYAWVCFMPDSSGTSHLFGHGQAHPFVVRPSGAQASASAPAHTATLRMTDYAFDVDAPLRAGANVIRVANDGADPHHVILLRIAPAKTMDDVRAWLENGMQGEPAAELAGAMGELSGGADAWLGVDLPPGDYVLVCLVAGRDEVPHIAKGMIRQVRVE